MIDLDAMRALFPCDVPVFPLPGAVLFPGALMPLHVFEPRYREMVSDALAGDRLIAMALLLECDREEYEARPPFHETVCVGHLLQHKMLPDGRSNIVLVGVGAGTARPTERGKPYRTAEVELIEEQRGDDVDALLRRVHGVSPPGDQEFEDLWERLAEILPAAELPGALLGSCAQAAAIPAAQKLLLLEESSIPRRAERLLEFLNRSWRWN